MRKKPGNPKPNGTFNPRPPRVVRAKYGCNNMYAMLGKRRYARTKIKFAKINGTRIFANSQYLELRQQKIEKHDFYNFSKLVFIYLSDIKSIGDYAFAKCSCLKFVSISNHLKEIGSKIFAYCRSIEIKYSGTIQEWDNINKKSDWAKKCNSIRVVCTDGEIMINS